jgi:YrbI family 3-deoxy-D-manno-octulosonate 8-phosphate phosphatase
MVRCWRGDGLGLRELERLGLEVIILSTEENPVVTARSRKLKVRCVQGCADKRVELDRILGEHGLALEEVAFVGNDINDLCCLEVVGLPVVVQDAHPSVLSAAMYRTSALGGYGAVREVCDLIVRVRKGAAF